MTFDRIFVVAVTPVHALVAVGKTKNRVPQDGRTVAECVVIEYEKRGGHIDPVRKIVATDTPIPKTRHEWSRLEPITGFGAPTVYEAVIIGARTTGHILIIQKISREWNRKFKILAIFYGTAFKLLPDFV